MKKTFQELADGEKLTAEQIADFFGWPEKNPKADFGRPYH